NTEAQEGSRRIEPPYIQVPELHYQRADGSIEKTDRIDQVHTPKTGHFEQAVPRSRCKVVNGRLPALLVDFGSPLRYAGVENDRRAHLVLRKSRERRRIF